MQQAPGGPRQRKSKPEPLDLPSVLIQHGACPCRNAECRMRPVICLCARRSCAVAHAMNAPTSLIHTVPSNPRRLATRAPQELESRKRAPLYQKKQEEELKAAVEKAQECEARAIEAELRAKELRAETEAAERKAAELQEALANVTRQSAKELADVNERHALEVQRLTLEASLQKVSVSPRVVGHTGSCGVAPAVYAVPVVHYAELVSCMAGGLCRAHLQGLQALALTELALCPFRRSGTRRRLQALRR